MSSGVRLSRAFGGRSHGNEERSSGRLVFASIREMDPSYLPSSSTVGMTCSKASGQRVERVDLHD